MLLGPWVPRNTRYIRIHIHIHLHIHIHIYIMYIVGYGLDPFYECTSDRPLKRDLIVAIGPLGLGISYMSEGDRIVAKDVRTLGLSYMSAPLITF